MVNRPIFLSTLRSKHLLFLLDSVASSFEDYLLLDDGTDFHHIFVEGVFVQRFVFRDGAAVVDSLVGKK